MGIECPRRVGTLTVGRMRVLIVKISSLGDVIHTLPAVTDAVAANPNVKFDWLVEEGFAEVPAWHPAVDQVIPVALRRWRENRWQSWRSGEWSAFRKQLAAQSYDLVIDAQGLVKSACLSRLATGPVAGMDKTSAREPLASLFYRQRFPVAKGQHAVERTRQLFAQALGYPVPDDIGQYGMDRSRLAADATFPDEPYLVFLHGTTRDDKHWPEPYWRELASRIVESGYKVLLPWGNDVERQRAEYIAQGHDDVTVLPRLNLAGVAHAIMRAKGVVAVDTGLGHLTAALDVPAVSLYGPTSPELVGTYGRNQCHLEAKDVLNAGPINIIPEVFSPLTADLVLDVLPTLFAENGLVSEGEKSLS